MPGAGEFARALPVAVAVVSGTFPFRKQVQAFQEALGSLRSVEIRAMSRVRSRAFSASMSSGARRVRKRLTGNARPNRFQEPVSRRHETDGDGSGARLGELDRPPGQGAGDASSSFARTVAIQNVRSLFFAKTAADPKARALPDYCPIRFLDVTIEPAKTYEYRVQVRMANPNYGKKTRVEKESLAEPKELLGPWTRVPGTATMAPDMLYYAVDAKRLDPKFPGRAPERDEVALQVHRWFGMYEFTRGTKTDYFGVGACVIAERVLARRGETHWRQAGDQTPRLGPSTGPAHRGGESAGRWRRSELDPKWQVRRSTAAGRFPGREGDLSRH